MHTHVCVHMNSFSVFAGLIKQVQKHRSNDQKKECGISERIKQRTIVCGENMKVK